MLLSTSSKSPVSGNGGSVTDDNMTVLDSDRPSVLKSKQCLKRLHVYELSKDGNVLSQRTQIKGELARAEERVEEKNTLTLRSCLSSYTSIYSL